MAASSDLPARSPEASGVEAPPVEALLSHAVATLPCVVYFFSPLVSWVLALLALALFTEFITPRSRLVLSAAAVVAGATVLASRAVGVIGSDDFLQYYPMYQGLANGEWDYLYTFAGGLEIALAAFFVVLSFFLGPASPTGVMLCVVLLSGGIFLVWLEKYALRYTSEGKRGLMAAFSILFFSFFLASQTVRQMISSTIILLAIFEPRRRVSYAYLALATVFHLSAIPVYLFFLAVRKWRWWGVLAAVAAGYWATTLFATLVQYVAEGAGFYGADKLTIYAGGYEGFSEADLGPLKWMLIVLGIGVFSKVIGRTEKGDPRDVFPIFVAFFLLHLVLLPIPLAPLRSTLLVSSVALGWFAFMFCQGLHRSYVKILFALILFWKLAGFLFLRPDDPFMLWTQYDWYGFLPGYFLL